MLHCILLILLFENVKLNPNNHYNHGFHTTFDYNHYMCSGYLLYTVTASGQLVSICNIIGTAKIKPVEYLKLSFETKFFENSKFYST